MSGPLLIHKSSMRAQSNRRRSSIHTMAPCLDAPSPNINSIPVEVLDNILHHSIKLYPQTRSYFTALTFIPPVRISHVCRRWRSVVESSPRLWTCISLRDRDGGVAYSKKLLEQDLLVLDKFATRSAQLPLELFILHDYRSASRNRTTLQEYEDV